VGGERVSMRESAASRARNQSPNSWLTVPRAAGGLRISVFQSFSFENGLEVLFQLSCRARSTSASINLTMQRFNESHCRRASVNT